jgi:hypothetical protein
MDNRINRKEDDSLYQPRIHSERVRTLYSLKQETGKPMTVLLDEAIREMAEKYRAGNNHLEESVIEKVRDETWEEILEYRKELDRMDYERCLVELENFKRKQSE